MDAARWLMLKEAEIHRGEWIDRDHAGVSFGNYARQWLQDRVLKELDTGKVATRPFSPVTVAKAYRLLHAVLETAHDDRLIRRNPRRIDGAGKEESSEREIVSLPVVFAVADAVPAR